MRDILKTTFVQYNTPGKYFTLNFRSTTQLLSIVKDTYIVYAETIFIINYILLPVNQFGLFNFINSGHAFTRKIPKKFHTPEGIIEPFQYLVF